MPRKSIWYALDTIHEQGLMHHDIINGGWGRNVVVDLEGTKPKIFIVDFEDARPHDCLKAPPIFSLGLEYESDSCYELWRYGLDAQLYAPGTCRWFLFCVVLCAHSSRSRLQDSSFVGTS